MDIGIEYISQEIEYITKRGTGTESFDKLILKISETFHYMIPSIDGQPT